MGRVGRAPPGLRAVNSRPPVSCMHATPAIHAGIKRIGADRSAPRVAVLGEIRGPIRKCWLALRTGARGLARPQLPHRAAFVPVPDRALRRRQNLADAPPVSVAAADPRADYPIR